MDYWVTVCVVRSCLTNWPEDDCVGYYQSIGLRCHPDDVKGMIRNHGLDGDVHWSETEWSQTNPNALGREVRRCFRSIRGDGIWYVSGRSYFSEW